MKTNLSIIESVCANPKRVDRQAGLIRGVKILGRISKNGREYSSQAMQEACQLYEGCRVNLDHPSKDQIKSNRSVSSQWGVLRNCRLENDGVYGDLEYLKSHPHTEQILEMAERWPEQIGLSHNADCVGNNSANGRVLIESVERVRSVDLVQRPATTDSLFEHEEPRMKSYASRGLKPPRPGSRRYLEDDTEAADSLMPKVSPRDMTDEQLQDYIDMLTGILADRKNKVALGGQVGTQESVFESMLGGQSFASAVQGFGSRSARKPSGHRSSFSVVESDSEKPISDLVRLVRDDGIRFRRGIR